MGNDLSFNIVALDRYEKTMLGLSAHLERIADKLDKLDGKTVTADVNIRTDESRKALDSFDTRFKLMAAGIVAASPFIGAAILGGVGAGFIGIAGLAQKSNADVQESYKGLWRNVTATTKNATDQLVPQIVGAGNAMSAEVVKLGPQIDRAFSFAGPSIVALTNGLTTMADNVMPGVTEAMRNSLPVMEGFSSLMGQLGTAAGQALTDLSKHSDEFGVSVQSLGGVASAATGTASAVIIDLNHVWAQNADGIVSATEGIGQSISGVATGAVPILSAGLGALTAVVTGVTDVLGPVAPILGTVGTVALATWGAVKLAGLASVGVKLLATGVLNLGANMEVGAAKTAAFIATQRGVAVSASATAAAVTAAGAATARASLGFAAAASSLAGPIGIALVAGTTLFGLFSSSQDHAAESALALASGVDSVTSALIANHGVANQSVEDAVKLLPAFSDAAKYSEAFGVTQAEIAKAVSAGGGALDALKNRLEAVAGAADLTTVAGRAQRHAADDALDGLKRLEGQYGSGVRRSNEYTAAQVEVGTNLLRTSEYQDGAASTANALGLELGEVAGGFRIVIAAGGAASNSVQDVTAAFIHSRLAVAQASGAIQDHFVTAAKAVVQAQTGLVDSNHSYSASTRAVTDAQHSLAGAQRSLKDAYAGVGTAQQALVRAQDQERNAQLALNAARQQSIQDLKDLHLQMEGQVVSEQQAKLRLFDVLQAGGKLGVSEGNAKDVASQVITVQSEERVKAALDILSAQNSLNDALNSGEKLRKDVTEADAKGADGAQNVVSAQEALRSAHEQVTSASNSLTKAQQQVQDADYSLQRAHQAVTDAEYDRVRSANRVQAAQEALRVAQDATSRSLDINTKAGQDNLRQIMTLWSAIEANIPVADRSNEMIRQTAAAFGISAEAAQALLTKLDLIPRDFRYDVTAVAGADLQAITQQTINGVKVFSSSLGMGGIASAGRLASGGPIVGAGGPTDDQNLIWASHGEWMQPADVVDYYGPGVMEAMRQKKLRVVGGDGAAFPGYAKGGMIDAFATYANLSTAYVADVNALTVMGLPHPAQLPKYVPPAPQVSGGIGIGIGGYTPGSGVAQWTPQILQALGLLGQSGDWLATVQRRMNQESGGNPTVVNKWDSNWLRGTPSVGLMQVIGPTFAHNAGQFAGTGPFLYGVSVDPLANIFSGLHYAIGRYGSLAALNRPGGYDSGGWLMSGGTNQTGRPEAVLNPDESEAFVRMAKGAAGRAINVYLTINAPVGSKRELKNWLVGALDEIDQGGRAPWG